MSAADRARSARFHVRRVSASRSSAMPSSCSWCSSFRSRTARSRPSSAAVTAANSRLASEACSSLTRALRDAHFSAFSSRVRLAEAAAALAASAARRSLRPLSASCRPSSTRKLSVSAAAAHVHADHARPTLCRSHPRARCAATVPRATRSVATWSCSERFASSWSWRSPWISSCMSASERWRTPVVWPATLVCSSFSD